MTSSDVDRSKLKVVVVGAGIVGICCALSLQERGFTVTIVDRDRPGAGASVGNAGVVSPWSIVPQNAPGLWRDVPGWLLKSDGPVSLRLRDLPTVLPWAVRFLRNCTPEKVAAISSAMEVLMRDNIATYRRHLVGTGRDDLLADSSYILVASKGDLPPPDAPEFTVREAIGAPIERIDGPTLREIEPDLSPDLEGAIVIAGQARVTSPSALVKTLFDKVVAQGGQFEKFNVEHLEVLSGGGISLHSNGVRMDADKVVLCAGAWSARLMERLEKKVPLIAERGYHTSYPHPGVLLNNSIMDVSTKVVLSSMEGSVRTAGTAEFARVDSPINLRRTAYFAAATRRLVPSISTAEEAVWMGPRASLPDSVPMIGAIDGAPNIFAAFGHSHYGMGMAPATGRLIATQIADETPNAGLSAFSPHRFD